MGKLRRPFAAVAAQGDERAGAGSKKGKVRKKKMQAAQDWYGKKPNDAVTSPVRVKNFCVYIMSNFSGTLYVGVTSDLKQRVYRHKTKFFPNAFTGRYRMTRLVYWEPHPNAWAAIRREKELKGWTRERKMKLILYRNPEWIDLAEKWFPRSY